MSGKVINLRTARKQAGRAAKAEKAATTAALHGRTKAQRDAEESAASKAARHLDQHKREPK